MSPRDIQILGVCLAVPLMIYAVHNNLWAEPLPESKKIEPAFEVVISHPGTKVELIIEETDKAEEHEIEIEVKELHKDTSDKELDLLARCVESEAGNQDLLGKQLVADVILNRTENENFPDTIEGVINQPGQFGVVRNGSIDKAVPSTETWEAVYAELDERVDESVIYFQAGGYSKFGEPWQKVGDHYFSK